MSARLKTLRHLRALLLLSALPPAGCGQAPTLLLNVKDLPNTTAEVKVKVTQADGKSGSALFARNSAGAYVFNGSGDRPTGSMLSATTIQLALDLPESAAGPLKVLVTVMAPAESGGGQGGNPPPLEIAALACADVLAEGGVSEATLAVKKPPVAGCSE